MTREPFTVTPETDLKDAVQILVDKKIGGVPVVNGNELVGIFTERDLMTKVVEPGKMASWIAPPTRGIDNHAIDFEYVRVG